MAKKIKSYWLLIFIILPVLIVGWRTDTSVMMQQKNSPGVVLVPIDFREGEWMMGKMGPQILPCDPPTPFEMGDPKGPVVQLLDRSGKVIYAQKLPLDPRIMLFEGPSEDSNILDEVSFVLTVQLVEGTSALQYYIESDEEGSVEKMRPVVEVDLGEEVEQYFLSGGREQTAVCQEPEYVPDALKREE